MIKTRLLYLSNISKMLKKKIYQVPFHADVNVLNFPRMKFRLKVVKEFRKLLAQLVLAAKEEVGGHLELGVVVVGLVNLGELLQVVVVHLSLAQRRFQKLHQ